MTVVTKCSKCAKSRNTVPLEGKKAAGLDGIAHTENPQEKGEKAQETLEDMQEGVVQALTTQVPPAEAFAGVHEYERGNGFGLGEHTAFGAITKGVMADEAFLEGVGTSEDNDSGPRRGPRRGSNQAVTTLNCLPWLSVAMGLLSMSIMVLAQLMAYVGDMGTDVVSSLRWAAAMTLAGAGYAGTVACAAKMLVFIFVLGLPPAAAYEVAGIGNRVLRSSTHVGKGHLQLEPTYKSAFRLTTLQANQKISRHGD